MDAQVYWSVEQCCWVESGQREAVVPAQRSEDVPALSAQRVEDSPVEPAQEPVDA